MKDLLLFLNHPLRTLMNGRKEDLMDEERAKRYRIPPWRKYSLSIPEAAEYYGIGEKRLRQIADENVGANFILEIGTHIRFKRKLFEEYLNMATVV